MRVLFVGNSYVYFNDLPGLVSALGAAGGGPTAGGAGRRRRRRPPPPPQPSGAPAGTYLAACVFYALLAGRTPIGLEVRTLRDYDGDVSSTVELAPEEVAFLQRVAWQTVADVLAPDRWLGTDPVDPDAEIDVDV